MGTEFDRSKYFSITPKEAKRRLGLPTDRPLILYISRFYKLKSVEHVLAAHESLKGNGQFTFCLVGGSEKDELFQRTIGSGVEWRPFLSHAEVLFYFRAADAYLSPFFICVGFDVSVMEALSFGVPVITRLLEELPEPDRSRLGVMVKQPEELVPAIMSLLDNREPFNHCREVAKRWFDWANIIERLASIYDHIH